MQTYNASPASMAVYHATAPLHALFATLLFSSRMSVVSHDAVPDTTNQGSPVLSAQLDALHAPIPTFASSVTLVNSLIMDSATPTVPLDQWPTPPAPPVSHAMHLVLPALSIPANAPPAHPAADRSSTSSASAHAQLEPIPSMEHASTALTAVPPVSDLTPLAHHAPQARSFTTLFAMISAPM